MNAKVIKFIGKATPVVKKFGPMVVGGITGIVEVISKQQAAAEMDDIKKRLADLETLFNQNK